MGGKPAPPPPPTPPNVVLQFVKNSEQEQLKLNIHVPGPAGLPKLLAVWFLHYPQHPENNNGNDVQED